MIGATPEQILIQRERRETLRHGIISKLSKQPELLNLWMRYQTVSDTHNRPEPESIIAVVNIHQDRITSLRTFDYRKLRKEDVPWLETQNLTCPKSGIPPQEATLFCITAEPTLKAIVLTPTGWNDCWVLQQDVDDYELIPALSPLFPIQVASKAISPLPHKVVMTPPINLVAIPENK